MALSYKTGVVAKSGTTTGLPFDQAVTGLGFQPKAIFLWFTGSNTGVTDILRTGMGMDDGTNHVSISVGADDNAVANTYRRVQSDQSLQYTAGGAVSSEIKIKTFDSDGFTLTYSNQNSTATSDIYYLAIGGSDVTNVKVGSITAATSAGTVGYTGVGFQPDIVFFMGANASSLATTTSGLVNFFGVAKSSSERGCMSMCAEDTGGATDNSRCQKLNKCITFHDPADSTAIDGEADFVSMDPNGFTLDWTDPAALGNTIFYMAIKGGRWKVGSFNQRTSTGTSATTGVGFTPKGLFLMSFNNVASSAIERSLRMSFGAGDSTTSRWSIWNGSTDAVNPSQTARGRSTIRVLRCLTENATGTSSTQDSAADIFSFDSDGFTINWTNADAVAREIMFVAAGDSPVALDIVKVVNETEETSESIVRTRLRIRYDNETEEISEGAIKVAGRRKVVNEQEDISESVIRVISRSTIQPDDFIIRLSGGALNTSPNASIGGAKSNTTVVDNAIDNLFDDVSSAEATAGDNEYRCFYLHNRHPTLTMQQTLIWIRTNTPGGDEVQIGLGTSAIGGTETAVANENTAPSGVTFGNYDAEDDSLLIGDIPAGSHMAIWVKRVVPAASPVYVNNAYELQCSCYTDHS